MKLESKESATRSAREKVNEEEWQRSWEKAGDRTVAHTIYNYRVTPLGCEFEPQPVGEPFRSLTPKDLRTINTEF